MLGPGEDAFGELIDHLESDKDLSGVPNLIYKSGHSIRQSEKLKDFDINEACTPEYVSVRPGGALPLETASGCYWGKCIFCYYPRQGMALADKPPSTISSVMPSSENLKYLVGSLYGELRIGFSMTTSGMFHYQGVSKDAAYCDDAPAPKASLLVHQF